MRCHALVVVFIRVLTLSSRSPSRSRTPRLVLERLSKAESCAQTRMNESGEQIVAGAGKRVPLKQPDLVVLYRETVKIDSSR